MDGYVNRRYGTFYRNRRLASRDPVSRNRCHSYVPLAKQRGGTITIWRARDLSVTLDGITGMRVKTPRPDQKAPSSDLVADRYLELDGNAFAAMWNTELRSAASFYDCCHARTGR